jgi:hypothetical protein
MRLSGPHSGSGRLGENENFLSLPGFELHIVQPVAYIRQSVFRRKATCVQLDSQNCQLAQYTFSTYATAVNNRKCVRRYTLEYLQSEFNTNSLIAAVHQLSSVN